MDSRKTIVAKGRRFRETLVSRGAFLCAILLLLGTQEAFAGVSAGAQAINQIASDFQGLVEPVRKFVFIIASIMGLVGAVQLFFKFQNGDQDLTKRAMMWFGGCFALLALAAALPLFFGT